MAEHHECAACAAAAANPLSGLARDGCRQCWVRRVSRMPKAQREEIYRATPPDELAQFVADVKAEYGRYSDAVARAAVERNWGPIGQLAWVKCGGHG